MNDGLTVKPTDTLDELSEPRRVRAARFGLVDSTMSPEARLDFEWVGQITYQHPSTFTEAEAGNVFLQLAGGLARAQCMMIIQNLPQEVAPTILPQLQEMAEYEIRMWQVRQELLGPDIDESWISLPITA